MPKTPSATPISLENPGLVDVDAESTNKPRAKPRYRSFEHGEEATLLEDARVKGPDYLLPVIEFTLETAIAQAELVEMDWKDVDMDESYFRVPGKGKKVARRIKLTKKAKKILVALKPKSSGSVFNINKNNTLAQAWQRMMDVSTIENLKFGDLRHEGLARMAIRESVGEFLQASGYGNLNSAAWYITHKRQHDAQNGNS
jgi:integrase